MTGKGREPVRAVLRDPRSGEQERFIFRHFDGCIVKFPPSLPKYHLNRRFGGTALAQQEQMDRDDPYQQRLLLSLLDNIPGMVYRGMPDWSLSFVGSEVERLTGFPPWRSSPCRRHGEG